MKISNAKLVLLVFTFLPSLLFGQKSKNQPLLPYKNPQLSVEERTKDLLQRMTLDEKVAQTLCYWLDKSKFITNGVFYPEKGKKFLGNGIGQIARPNEKSVSESLDPQATVKLANTLQKYMLEQTRLGIPIIFHEESLHGNQAKAATSFPTPLAMSCSWNEDLMKEVYTSVAAEVRARGAQFVLAPVVDVARDPRWGRTEETMGEDPYLIARLGSTIVKTYQGPGPKFGAANVASTLKHFGVHGMPEGGSNIGPVSIDERTARSYLLYPFEYCVKNAGVWGVMPCYNELNGQPLHSHTRMLTDILRKDWGFKGIVASDYFAVNEIRTIHHVTKDTLQTALAAFKAGVDMELPDPANYTKLKNLVGSKAISINELDTVVARILRLKFLLGLFENPYTSEVDADKIIGSPAIRQVALKAARQSIVLLKNQNNLLPLDVNKYKKIAVIGPNANVCILGGYSNEPRQRVTPLQAIKTLVGNKAEVLYAEGCRINETGDWFKDSVVLASRASNLKRIEEAKSIAAQADVVLLFLGGNEATFREAWSKTHMGDLTNLDLFTEQNELVKAIKESGKPFISCVFSGPPMAFKYLSEVSPALLQCWFLGQETGTAVAEVLFGQTNPSGKLTISIPRSTGHLPCYYNYKPSARRGYHFDSISPLYPFGFGLSYASFWYGKPVLSRSSIKNGESANISIEVTNTSNKTGDEIVQLYVRDEVSSFTRPVKELKDFVRISLQPGEKKLVEFQITSDKLSLLDANYKPVVEPGDFDIMIGASSEKYQKVKLTVE